MSKEQDNSNYRKKKGKIGFPRWDSRESGQIRCEQRTERRLCRTSGRSTTVTCTAHQVFQVVQVHHKKPLRLSCKRAIFFLLVVSKCQVIANMQSFRSLVAPEVTFLGKNLYVQRAINCIDYFAWCFRSAERIFDAVCSNPLRTTH